VELCYLVDTEQVVEALYQADAWLTEADAPVASIEVQRGPVGVWVRIGLERPVTMVWLERWVAAGWQEGCWVGESSVLSGLLEARVEVVESSSWTDVS